MSPHQVIHAAAAMRGKSVAQLCEEAGLKPNTVYRWAARTSIGPRRWQVMRFAHALGIPPRNLLPGLDTGTVAGRVELACGLRGLSRSSLARKSGVRLTRIRWWLDSGRLPADAIAPLCRALGVSADWLCGIDGREWPE